MLMYWGANMTRYSSMVPNGYMPRIADVLIEEALRDFGAVEVCGTRWCGKSWSALAAGESITRVDINSDIYRDDPSLALVGARPHVIDEWQDVPAIWNHVRHQIDDSGNRVGQFILTGSSAPMKSDDDAVRHSGAGRIARVGMSTMTCSELGLTQGSVSLSGLFRGEFAPAQSSLGLADIALFVCAGGWPALAGRENMNAANIVRQYLNALFEESMVKAGKNPYLARRLAVSLARNVATSVKLSTLAEDAAAGETVPATATVASYLSEFKRNYFIVDLLGWDAPVRAKSRLRTKPKRYFADPSLAVGLLGVDEQRLLLDSQLMGLLFESLVVHDLSVYAQLLPGYAEGSLRYYSDSDGLEVDVVIELTDGRWAAIEIKLGESKTADGISNLKRLRAKVASNPAARNPQPTFMAVVLGKGAVARYMPDDDVYVIPFDTLTA